MSQDKPPENRSVGGVDWSDPRLDALLKKTESWQLDNRSSFSPQDVRIHIGSKHDIDIGITVTNAGRPGTLVWEHELVMVVETNFPIEQGEVVRLDRLTSANVRTHWGTVVDSRQGRRAGDGQNHIYVHWIALRPNP
jgi:hypothetical protein